MDWRQVGRAVLDFVYPAKCCLCDEIGMPAVCQHCQLECNQNPSAPSTLVGQLCLVDAVFAYEGRPLQAVRRLKYDRATGLGQWMSQQLRDRFEAERLDGLFDVVVPVPLAKGRLSERGFNQAELLATSLPNVSTTVLKRIRETPQQVRLDAATRRANLAGAFWASPEIAGQRILLIDDVYTTGATMEACADVLKAAGALEVGCLCFCQVLLDRDATDRA